ncbi:MAG: alpha/beta fold hydrolase [Gammaproteobacteria bacterium]|nr:alpha/beta fold hydrolase [Gammaproteobacteria bacterium]
MKSGKHGIAIWRIVKRLAILGTASYVLVCAVLYVLQDHFVYFPTESSTKLTLPAEEYEISPSTDAKVVIHGYVVNRHANGPVVIFFTGNAGDARSYVNVLGKLNAPVTLTNYRGYGKGRGTPSEKTILSDARHMLDRTKAEFPNRSIVLMGFSLGSGVAMLTADETVDGLILVSPYRSLVHIATRSIMRIFPLELLMRSKFDSRPNLDELPNKVLVLYSSIDRTIPTAETLSVLNYLPQADVVVDDVPHNLLLSGPENVQEIKKWLNEKFDNSPLREE